MSGIVRSLLIMTAIGLLAVVLLCVSDDSEALDNVSHKVNFNSEEVLVYYGGFLVDPLTDIEVGYTINVVEKTGYHSVTINGTPYDYDPAGYVIIAAERDSGILIQTEKIQYSIDYETTIDVIGTFPDQTTYCTIDSTTTIVSPLFSRVGYHFEGWNTLNNGTGDDFLPGNYNIDADFITDHYGVGTSLILYPKWSIKEYSIGFNLNNGTGQLPERITEKTLGMGTTIQPVNLTRTGYTTAIWNTSPDGSGLDVDIGDAVFDAAFITNYFGDGTEITLYPKWVANHYAIRFDSTEEIKGALPDSLNDFTIGSAINISTAPLTRTGYILGGWNTSADRSGIDLQPGNYTVDTVFLERYYEPSGRSLILYPKWIPVEYSISLSSEFGTVSAANWSLVDSKLSRSYNIESETIPLPALEPDDRFHLFINWEDSEGNPVSQIATGTIGNIELKAAWMEKNYPVTARINGKLVTFDLTLSSEMPYAEPEDGFEFKGWYYRDDEGNEVKFESMSQMTENMEIYAVFEPTQDDPMEIAACVIAIIVFFIVVIGYGFTKS